jgi:DNA-binding MarR family transcriptional regulator
MPDLASTRYLPVYRSLPESTRQKLLEGLEEMAVALAPSAEPPAAPSAAAIEDLMRARARRAKFFNPRLFADPAWDMLLELFAAELRQKKLAVTSLGIASGVPPTTALRWMSALQHEGLVERQNDPLDGRRVFVSLTPAGLQAMEHYFAGLPASVRPL